MVTDNLTPKSLKRPYSPSAPSSPTLSPMTLPTSLPTLTPRPTSPSTVRPPKRLRKSHASEPISAATLSSLESSNPLNRRNLKRAAKRERKALRFRHKVKSDMEVDDQGGLEETFMSAS